MFSSPSPRFEYGSPIVARRTASVLKYESPLRRTTVHRAPSSQGDGLPMRLRDYKNPFNFAPPPARVSQSLQRRTTRGKAVIAKGNLEARIAALGSESIAERLDVSSPVRRAEYSPGGANAFSPRRRLDDRPIPHHLLRADEKALHLQERLRTGIVPRADGSTPVVPSLVSPRRKDTKYEIKEAEASLRPKQRDMSPIARSLVTAHFRREMQARHIDPKKPQHAWSTRSSQQHYGVAELDATQKAERMLALQQRAWSQKAEKSKQKSDGIAASSPQVVVEADCSDAEGLDAWRQLATDERDMLEELGWTQELYNIGDGPETPWSALSERQRLLAMGLGHDAERWAVAIGERVEDRQMREEEAALRDQFGENYLVALTAKEEAQSDFDVDAFLTEVSGSVSRELATHEDQTSLNPFS